MDRFYGSIAHYYANQPSHVSVDIHAAPATDSVRMLKEFQDQAYKNILAQFEVKNTVVEGIITFSTLDYASDRYKVAWQFKINGKRYDILEELPRARFNINTGRKEELLPEFYKKVSEVIAQQLLTSAFEDADFRRTILEG